MDNLSSTRHSTFDRRRKQSQRALSRKAFAYTVVCLDETRVLGCVYINPPETNDLDAVVVMWVSQTEYDKGLDEILFNAVKDWISSDWPFKTVDYLGRV